MKQKQGITDKNYRQAMGRLLVMYTQVDYLIMRAVAERIASAPDDESRLFMARQTGDESKHVRIQQQWIKNSAATIHRCLTIYSSTCSSRIFVR